VQAIPARTYLTALEVASRFGVSPQHVYNLCRDKVLPSVHLGRCLRIPVAKLEDWESQQSDTTVSKGF